MSSVFKARVSRRLFAIDCFMVMPLLVGCQNPHSLRSSIKGLFEEDEVVWRRGFVKSGM